MRAEARRSGIGVVGDVRWGTHMCHFYHSREDLADILVSYFKAGLENNEFCMWLTSEPLGVEDAKASLRKAVRDFDDYIQKGQIEIVDASQSYTRSGKFESEKVLQGWLEKHDQALEKGFDGLRLSGNTLWLEDADWKSFADYEAAVDGIIGKYRMIAICSYSLEECGASEIVDVVGNHQFAIIRRRGKWEVLETAEHRRAEQALRESEERFRNFLDNLADVAYEADSQGNITYANKMAEKLAGLPLSEILGKPFLPLFTEESQRTAVDVFRRTLNGESPEYELTGVNGRIGHFKNEPLRDRDGKIVGVFGIARDITERKRAEEAYRALVEHSLQGLVILQDARVLFANRAFTEISGYTVEEMLAMSPQEVQAFVHPEDQSLVWGRHWSRLKGEHLPERYEFRGIRKDGSVRWLEIHASMIDYQGKPAVQAAYVDITERKKAEKALADSEALYRSLVESLPQNIFRKDTEGKFTFANTSFLSTVGRTLDQVAGKTDFDFYPKELALKYRADDRNVIETGETIEDVEEHHTTDGRKLYVQVVKTPVYDSRGNITGVQGIFWDFTERKSAEKESETLARLGTRLAGATSLESVVAIVREESDRLLSWDAHYLAMGWAGEDSFRVISFVDTINGKKKVFGGKDWPTAELSPPVRRILDGHPVLINRAPGDTGPALTRLGDKHHLSASLMYVPVRSGEAIIGLLSVQSYTHGQYGEADLHTLQRIADAIAPALERAHAEDALRESEERYRAIFEQAADSIVLVNGETGALVGFNDRAHENLGYTRREFRKLTIPDIEVIESAEQVARHIERIIKEGSDTFETKHRTKEGNIRDVEVSSTALSIRGRGFVQSIWRDITERKRAEDALRESEKKYRRIVQTANEGIWVVDAESETLFVNDRMAEMLGYSPAEMMGKLLFDFMDDEWRAIAEANVQRRRQAITEQQDFKFRRKDGTELWTIVTTNPFFDEQGRYAGALGMITDITDRKRAEEALRASENKYRTLLENLPQKVFLKDRNSVYVSCNENYARDLKIKSKDIVGKTDYDFYPRQLAEKYRADDRRIMESGHTEDIEEKYIQEGQEVTVHTVKTPVKDEQGDCVGVLGVFWDITEHKRAEEALRESEERYRTLVENIDLGITLITPDRKIIMTNAAHGRFFHKPASDFVGKYCFREFEKREAVCPHCPGTQAIAARRPAEVETEGVRDDGSRIPVRIHAFPLFGSGGEVSGFIEVVEDITERERAQEEKRQLQEQLAQAQKMEALVTLSGGIAHEFNNILASNIGYIDLILQTEQLSESARRNLETARRSAVRGANLTRSLLTFSRKDIGEKKRVDLKEIVDEVLELTAKEFTTEGIEVMVKHSTKAPMVMANRGLLSSVVMNLVINARHAMLKSRVKKLTVQTGLEKRRAFVRVRDTGCGIPKKDLARVFEPFFTTKGSLAGGEVYDGKARGTGLGLSVCHSIVQAHGGQVTVNSQVGRGTTFTVYLPAASRRETTRRKLEQRSKEGISRVLVVDDEEAIADLIVDILDNAGYAADAFTDPKEALEALRREKYSVALIDLQMPEMNGEDFIGAVNCLPPERRPLKVILTGRLAVSEKDCSRLDVFAMLPKPFATEQVLEIVEQALAARVRAADGDGNEASGA